MEDENEEQILNSYPEGNYAVVQGSVADGYKFWGPFSTVKAAVEWADKFRMFLGFVSVVAIEPVSKFPVSVNEETLQGETD